MYQRWCAVNSLAQLPDAASDESGSQRLLRFLHAHHGQWGAPRARALSSAIADRFVASGLADPRDYRATTYIDALAHLDTPKEASPALTPQQLSMIAERAEHFHAASDLNIRLRGVLAVTLASGLDPTDPNAHRWAWTLPPTAFAVTDSAITITDPGSIPVTIGRAERPCAYRSLRQALAIAPHGEAPLATRCGERAFGASRPSLDTGQLRQAWCRAKLGADTPQGLATRVRASLPGMTTSQQELWIDQVDPHVRQRTRAVTYLLVGSVTTWRAADLARLTLGSVRGTSSGYEMTTGVHKSVLLGRRDARDLVATIDHLPDAGGVCPSHCPACWLSRHLALRKLDGAQATDVLFESRAGKALDATTSAADLDGLWALLTDEEKDGIDRVRSRSMRVTGVTYARKSGEPYESIALRTGHAYSSTTDRYVRRNRLELGELVLDLHPDSPPDD